MKLTRVPFYMHQRGGNVDGVTIIEARGREYIVKDNHVLLVVSALAIVSALLYFG
jgi:uncharacterized protein (DUF779 family)